MSVVTAITSSNRRKPQVRASRPKGNAAIAAVSDGLFDGRTHRRVSEMQRLSEILQRASRIGHLAAA